jgi:PAS domain-containing protein
MLSCATYATIGGSLTFAGWAVGADRLTDWNGVGIAMKVNAAIAATAGGLALLVRVLVPRARTLFQFWAIVVAALGGLALFEHLTSLDLGIDTLLFDEPSGAMATAAPGRMGPPAAAAFTALGIALALLPGSQRARSFSVALSVGVLALSTLTLTGYWYGVTAMYTFPRLTGISLQALSMLLALAVGIIAANPDRQPLATLLEDSNAGVLARRVVPLAFIVPLAIGWLRLKGQEMGLFDEAFGTAVRSVSEVAILSGLLWGCLTAIRQRDNSARQALERERRSDKLVSETLESITDGFFAFDEQWRFTFVNAVAERLLHRSRRYALLLIWSLFPHVVGAPLHAQLHRAVRDRVMVAIEGEGLIQGALIFMHRIYPTAGGGSRCISKTSLNAGMRRKRSKRWIAPRTSSSRHLHMNCAIHSRRSAIPPKY